MFLELVQANVHNVKQKSDMLDVDIGPQSEGCARWDEDLWPAREAHCGFTAMPYMRCFWCR